MFKKRYDFIAIGDQTTDAFIHLREAEVHSISPEKKLICMRFADKIPYDNVEVVPAVGNSANAAVCAARLGLKSALVSNIGADVDGRDALAVYRHEHVSRKYIKINKNKKTNYHYVLSFRGERTILIKHENFTYTLPNIGKPSWIYLSSIGEHSLSLHRQVERYLSVNPEIKLAFQPGTFQIKMGKDRLAGIYRRTEVFIANREEAQKISGYTGKDIKKLLDKINGLGPKTAVITDGKEGAYIKESGEYWFMPPYPDARPPRERT
ncbi:MAG: carbohydrate kinase family protein, partial [Candidatus Colwellbacteria bacterium]|nr:carbohydrate kinase family protein [Candidatus Colwellbacteria bacterium]